MLDLTQMASDGGAFRIFQLFYLDEHDATWVPYTGVENSAFTTETAMIWAATETAVRTVYSVHGAQRSFTVRRWILLSS
jgi:hypothetical protein